MFAYGDAAASDTDELLLWAVPLMVNSMQCSSFALQVRKQIRFRRYCDIGKVQFRFEQISYQECISSMLGEFFPLCKLNLIIMKI